MSRAPLLVTLALLVATRVATASALDLGALRTLTGATANGQFGIACAVVGDMDGDGYAEYAIGASADPTGGSGAGRVFIYRGGPAHAADGPAWVITGSPGDLMGAALAPAGDLDGDGLADLLIGAPASLDARPGAPGRVLIAYGSPSLGSRAPVSLTGPLAGAHFGASLAGLGAFRGGDRADFAVGAPQANGDAGAVFVYAGSAAPGAPFLALHGLASGDEFGTAVAGVGATRGANAAPDLAIGAPYDSRQQIWGGSVGLWMGGTAPDTLPARTWFGLAAGDLFGSAVAGIGDVDGNGAAEVVVGAPGANSGPVIDTGAAYVFLGSSTPPLAASVTLSGERPDEDLGRTVAGIGDVDGDGLPDLAISAPSGADSTATGSVEIFLGRSFPWAAPDTVLDGAAPGGLFGHAVSNGGAVDAGHHALFLAGSYAQGTGGEAELFGSGLVTVSVRAPASPTADALFAPSPNPVSRTARLTFSLARATTARLEMLDLSGRRVATILDQSLDAGVHSLAWTTGTLPAGVYWLALTTPETRLSRRVILLAR
jgi:hypothetical protein